MKSEYSLICVIVGM